MIDSTTLQLAHIIAGEAGGCGLLAMVAVAHIWTRNKRWSGYGPITPASLLIAITYRYTMDPTYGSNFLFSRSDLRLPAVQDIIKKEGRASPIIFRCPTGDLYAY